MARFKELEVWERSACLRDSNFSLLVDTL